MLPVDTYTIKHIASNSISGHRKVVEQKHPETVLTSQSLKVVERNVCLCVFVCVRADRAEGRVEGSERGKTTKAERATKSYTIRNR